MINMLSTFFSDWGLKKRNPQQISRNIYKKWFNADVQCTCTHLLYTILRSFHSKKLHIFGFLDRTRVTSSLVIFFFVLSCRAVYHFCSRNLPWRLNNNINCICKKVINTCNNNNNKLHDNYGNSIQTYNYCWT